MIQADRKTVMQVFGGLMNKPELLSDTDKYQLEPSDFDLRLDRYIFSAIYNLYIQGAEKIHVQDIDNFLSTNEVAKKILNDDNGLQFLLDCETNAELGNFNVYYNKLKKFNLLRDLKKGGYDVSSFYCDDPLNIDFEVNENFEKLTTTQIVNHYKTDLANYEEKYTINTTLKEGKVSNGIRNLLKELKKVPEVGVRLQGEIFNTITRGGRKGKLYLRSAGTGVGKAVPNYTKIPTPSGWKAVGEIKVGDLLFDRLGNPTKVLSVFPQQEKKEIYRVYFKSGRVAECCDEHLWSYYSNNNNRNPNKLITATLKDIINDPRGLRDSKGQYRWSIPITEPVKYPEKFYLIDPYVMGLILGDGSFRYDLSNKSFSFSSADEELVQAICDRQGYLAYKKSSKYNYNWNFELTNQESHKNVWVEDILSEYPELWQLKSENKYIPQEFLLGSIEQRYDLLAGLLDTDGSIDKKGRINFTTTSPLLRDNVIELCESLGLTCNYCVDTRKDKYTTGECYNLHIQAPKAVKPKLFKLKRKLDIAIAYANNGKREERRDRDFIIKIESTGEFVDMTCFYVDNDEHLFLMNNYICTHNTRSMVGDACNIAYPIRFEPKYGKWMATGLPEKVLYVMTEQEPEEIQTMVLAYLTGINEEAFLYGKFKEEDEDRIEKAIEIMETYSDYFLTAQIPDPSASVVKNLFRRYNLQHGVENFFYDYIFSSPAMLNEYRDLGLQEHVCLRLFTTALKNLATELNAFILTSTQISNDEGDGFKDFRNIRGSKSICDLVDFACIMSRPSIEELRMVSTGFQKLYNLQPDCVIDVFKNRRGRWTQLRIWTKNDLGICRKYDLFVTTPDLKPIEKFSIVNFAQEKDPSLIELENKFNEGLEVKEIDLNIKELEEEPTSLLDSVKEAFGDTKKRISKKDFSDFL